MAATVLGEAAPMSVLPSDAEIQQARNERELTELRAILQQHPELYRKFYVGECVEAMKSTIIFADVDEKLLTKLATMAERCVFPAGTMITREQVTVKDAFVISSGEVRRWADVGGRQHSVMTFCDKSIGTLHLWNHDAQSRFNAECLSDVIAYRIERRHLERVFMEQPAAFFTVIGNLSAAIRQQQRRYDTPLLEQRGHKASFTSTTIAAFVESFYRSAMNNLINMRVTGEKGAWFPDMHVQSPIRILYINGIKQIRTACDEVDCNAYTNPSLVRALLSFAPGVIMCPFSSVLEASNVPAAKNPEALAFRWTRGFAPRLVREVLFGIGINQVADYFAERYSFLTESTPLKQAFGSITAGVVSGYLSHVPHVLSTQKLFNPKKSYVQLWRENCEKSVHLVPASMPSTWRRAAASFTALVFPIGVVRRSIQICGTFIIINGTTYALRDQDWY